MHTHTHTQFFRACYGIAAASLLLLLLPLLPLLVVLVVAVVIVSLFIYLFGHLDSLVVYAPDRHAVDLRSIPVR